MKDSNTSSSAVRQFILSPHELEALSRLVGLSIGQWKRFGPMLAGIDKERVAALANRIDRYASQYHPDHELVLEPAETLVLSRLLHQMASHPELLKPELGSLPLRYVVQLLAQLDPLAGEATVVKIDYEFMRGKLMTVDCLFDGADYYFSAAGGSRVEPVYLDGETIHVVSDVIESLHSSPGCSIEIGNTTIDRVAGLRMSARLRELVVEVQALSSSDSWPRQLFHCERMEIFGTQPTESSIRVMTVLLSGLAEWMERALTDHDSFTISGL